MKRLLRILRNILFALLPLLVVFGLAEGALWLAGLGSPAEQLSLSRGFDEQASYIVPDVGPPGTWRTQMNEGETDEIRIPPKGAKVRVLLFGGSNTELFPEDYLEVLLDRAAPDPGFEVFNLGRRGYGSERVRILLEQSLVTEPDVVVIYCGHNEFVEGEFKLQLRDLGRPWLAEAGAHLRTVNVLSSWLRRLQHKAPGTGAKPEARIVRSSIFDDITFDTTQLYLDAYRQNLRSMCRSALDAGARVLISTLVTNVLVVPSVAQNRPVLSREEQIEFHRLRVECLGNLPERLTAGITARLQGPDVVHLRFEDWRETQPPDPAGPGRPVPVLRPLAGILAGGPLWSDPTLWEPRVWALMHKFQLLHERALEPGEREALQRAVAAGEKAVALDGRYARMLFELGIAVYLLGDDDARAVALLDEAARQDCAPTHANDIINGIVRQTAAAFPEAAFVDAERLFRDCCPDRLVGYEVMMDNCHLHLGSRQVLMRQFVPEIVRLAAR